MSPNPDESTDLLALGHRMLTEKKDAAPATRPVLGGGTLRQTLLVLRGGEVLGDHTAPGDASLLVLEGDATLVAGDRRWRLTTGGHAAIPPEIHSVEAQADSIMVISVSRS